MSSPQPTSQLSQAAANLCHCHFVDGACLEILGEVNERYWVQFIDQATQSVVHEGLISNNQWIKTARSYFTRWSVVVTRQHDQQRVFSHHYDCEQQRVYIALESASLGDTLAWLPAIEAFRQTHHCQMLCSTFMNSLFAAAYPDIEFIEPGTTVTNLYALYRLGWYYAANGQPDEHKNPRDFRHQPLAATAYTILGLPYLEQRPKFALATTQAPIDVPYVCIAVHATAQAKYWNNPSGWQEVVDFLQQRGYRVILLSKEGHEFMGNTAPANAEPLPAGDLTQIIRYLQHARCFIGIGSGLSWLSWAVGCPTCLISGFSAAYTEMQDCIRLSPPDSVCSGCFNREQLQADNWLWCPDQQGTPRMFECTRSISAQQVITAITPLL